MQLKPNRAWVLPLLLAIVSVVVIGASLGLRYLDLDTYKTQIVAQVRESLKRDLTYQSGDFSLRFGPSFTFGGVAIREKDGSGDFIKADHLTIRIAIIPLLQRKVVISRIQLERPVVELSRDRNGVFNVSDLFTATPGGEAPGIGGVELKKARVTFTDNAVSDKPVVTQLDETDLYLSRLVRGKNCDLKLSGSLVSGTGKVPVFLAGLLHIPAPGASFRDSDLNCRVKTGYLDGRHFWPYYSRFVPFQSLAGGFSLEGNIKGRLSAFKSKGELKVANLNLDYPKVFHARLTPKSVKLNYELELTPRDIDIPVVKLSVDGLNVNGSCRLADIHSSDPRIIAKATTNRFNLKDFRQFIPYGIIVKDPADFIEQKIMGGLYRLEEGKLDGRVSQILHMERGQNYNILSVRARVEEGVVAYGSGIPVFSGIKGELLLAGKDFILKGMTGKFGTSKLSLDGRITDYPLDVTSRYLFTANVLPRQPEAAWLFGHGHGEKLTLSDGATLRLSGEGTTTLYNLAGDADLGSVAYSYPDLVSKPQGRPNTLSFRMSFGKEEYRITSMTYNLAPLSLSIGAVSRYNGPITVDLRSNNFSAAEVAPFLPTVRKYQPTGRVAAQLRGTGPALVHATWSGTVGLAGVSLKLTESMKPVTGVTGSLRINGELVETSQLSVRMGNSTLTGRGSLTGFQNPTVSLSFSSPAVDLADLGLTQGKGPRVERVQGILSYSKEKDHLQIGYLAGTLGKSTLQVKGSVHDLKRPQIDVVVTSPHLEVEDLAPLFASSPEGKTGSPYTIKAQVSAQEGKAKDVPFQRLKTTVMLEDHILYLQPLEVSVFDGDLSGRVRVDYTSGAPRYQVNCSMQKVSAERVFRALGVQKQEITGTLSLQGELNAKGDNAMELRKTSLGAVKLKVEHGTIRKFSTLSKIFSILNLSQLFKLQLPDMVSGGMPYNKITGDLAIRDGSVSTQNLFMDSNAINLSAIGKLDMVKDELDLTIGVQPLQTVDKVVNHIPIVGWILTGKDRSFITTYFEAKGRIEDPKVTAVPVKSLAKGVMNVFRRVFELPGRLVTDTGEVLIGK